MMVKGADNSQDLKKEVTELESKVEELTNNWKRALADYHNLAKRLTKEKEEWGRFKTRSLLKRFLAIYDALVSAQTHLNDSGLDLVLKEFEKFLQEEGIKRIDTEGKEFNPQVMECVEVVRGENEGRVAQELTAGFIFENGELVRAAQVRVFKKEVNEKAEELAKEELGKGDYM